MSETKPERFPVAYVEWIDSGTLATGWEPRADVLAEGQRQADTPIRSAGLLVDRNKKWVILAVGWAPHADDLMHALWIPMVNVSRIDVWEPAEASDSKVRAADRELRARFAEASET